MADRRILIVEDSRTLRQLLRFALRRLSGVEIVEAADGIDGLRQLMADRFDLVFVDLDRPGMDGVALIERVRAESELAALPICAVTKDADGSDGQRALALGADGCLGKPIEVQRVLSLARSLLKREA